MPEVCCGTLYLSTDTQVRSSKPEHVHAFTLHLDSNTGVSGMYGFGVIDITM